MKIKYCLVILIVFLASYVEAITFINKTDKNIKIDVKGGQKSYLPADKQLLKSNAKVEVKHKVSQVIVDKENFKTYLTSGPASTSAASMVVKFNQLNFDSKQPKECKIKKTPSGGLVINSTGKEKEEKKIYFLECS